MLDFEVQRCTRHCAATDRPLEPGEAFYSVLVSEGAEIARRDYSKSAWNGPPPDALGWWKSQVPGIDTHKPRLAPNQILLELFMNWQDDATKLDIRYVLTLLMIRRRVLRLEATESTDDGTAEMILYCARIGESFRVPVAEPEGERVAEIQAELGELLFARAE